MSENTENTVEAVEVPKVEIIRGRMPVAVVALIRFNEDETTTSACAAKYRTTVGKVDDIKKGRNFGYIDEDFAPTEDQVVLAMAYIEQLDDAEQISADLDAMGIAEDGGEAFEAKRSALRKSTKKVEADTEEVVEEESNLDELVD